MHRPGPDGTAEVLLVHRPRYDDWSLPKGKLDDGETELEGALREVEEETGLTCRPGRFLGRTEYTDNKGRPKMVAYWAMEPLSGEFEPGDEVDKARWLPIEDAAALLSYEHDRDLLRALGG